MNAHFKTQFQTYSKAVLEKNLNLFLSLYDEKVFVFDMWEKWSNSGLSELQVMTKEWFDSIENDSEIVIVEFTDICESSSGDIGYATAFVKFQAQNLEGKSIRYLENRLTWILERRNNEWKIIHQHTSSPIDSSLKAILHR